MDDWRDDGFQYIYIASQDAQGNVPDQSDLESWAEKYDMVDIPVLTVPSSEQNYPDGMTFTYEADLYIPTIYHISPQMEVQSADEGIQTPRRWLSD